MNEATKVTEQEVNVLSSFDARVWAKEFIKTNETHNIATDEGTMIAWFANALMRGYDEANSHTAALPQAWTLDEIKAAFRSTTPRTAEYELQLMEFTQRLTQEQPAQEIPFANQTVCGTSLLAAQPAESQPSHPWYYLPCIEGGTCTDHCVIHGNDGLLAEARREGELAGVEKVCVFADKLLSDGFAVTPKRIRAKFLPQPTPEERVTVEEGIDFSGAYWIKYKVDGKEFSKEEIKAALIAQLKQGGTK